MVLYRKYRPQKFSELVGQEHIKKILTNAIKSNNVSHAYLFSGPRGVGKTTVARLLAKALNCQKRSAKDSEPCDKCITCQEIKGDRSLDVIEIDAASNRGIDEIRELRDKIRFLPSGSKYKVYIIDEVHMLTREAFNALLKTLEEPPKHAIFIMATTELYRVPDTIISRSQQLDFKKASIKEIYQNLENICNLEDLVLEHKALDLIARHADGSYRDGLSLLDQVASMGEKKILLQTVSDVLGIPPRELIDNFVESLLQKNVFKAIKIVNDIYSSGYDLAQFTNLVIDSLRQSMIEQENYLFLELIEVLLEAKAEIRYSHLPVLPLELAIVKICGLKPNKEMDIQKTPKNIIPVDNKAEKPKEVITARITQREQILKEKNKPVQQPEQAKSTNIPVTLDNIKAGWKKVFDHLKEENHSLNIILAEAKPIGIKENIIQISVSNKFYAERLREPRKYQILTTVFEKIFKEKLGFECVVGELPSAAAGNNSKELVDNAIEIFDSEE